MGFISKDIGIDLGTSNIRICVKGKGIVIEEPSVVAINKITGEILAIGSQAKEMLGRTPDNIVAVRPLKDGVIADFNATVMLIQTLIDRVIKKSMFSKPRVIVSIPSGITDVEERAAEGVTYKAGAKDVYLIEEVMAAAIGSGIQIEQPEGSMIIDIGGGTSEMAVLSLGGIVVANTTRIGGNKLDLDIINYVKNNFNVIIGSVEAEEIKKQIGAAYTTMNEEKVNVKGRNLTTGLPENIVVTTKDVNNAISDSLKEILKYIKATLEVTPPELASDIMERGIILSGSGAYLKNIDRFISTQIGIPVFIADSPERCVINGINKTLESIEILKKSVKTK